MSAAIAPMCGSIRMSSRNYLFFQVWIRNPALGFFILWVFLQLIGVYYQVSGFSNVSALAHLGGMSVGVVFYLIWRKKA
jgi:membrane associated rhomboid family serine protease